MIDLFDFTKKYRDFTAVDRVNLHVERGDIYGLIGPNGAGKTTIIRFLATLLLPTVGRGMVSGYDVVRDCLEVRRNLGYMPDNFGLYPGMETWAFLDFFARAYGLKQAKRLSVINDVLTLVDLEDKRFDSVDSLSRGMKQRLCLAKTLLHDPPVLILDEPAAGLDPLARREMQELLKELGKMNKTILISSHLLAELSDFCNKIAIINHGKLLIEGPIENVLGKVRSCKLYEVRTLTSVDKVAFFLGQFQPVRILSTEGDRVRFEFHGPDEMAAGLLTELAKANLGVVTFADQSLTLEEAFLTLTAPKKG
jgi:ABC-2 type transport system ATP-binding protein